MKNHCKDNKAAVLEGPRDNLISLHQQAPQEKQPPAQQAEATCEDINLCLEDIEDQLLRMSLDVGEAQKSLRQEQHSLRQEQKSLRDEVADIHSRIARLEDNLAARTGSGKNRSYRLPVFLAITVITTLIATFGFIELNSARNQAPLSAPATAFDTPIAAKQIQDSPSR